MRQCRALFMCLMAAWAAMAAAAQAAKAPPAPQSDGCVLHVDFENYVDGSAIVLNAGVRQEVTWRGPSAGELPRNKPVRLKFTLRNAKLYSFWTEGT